MTLLSSLLRSLYGPELEIGTVDGMQGREKEAVVISLVRSNNKVLRSMCYRVVPTLTAAPSVRLDSSKTNADSTVRRNVLSFRPLADLFLQSL